MGKMDLTSSSFNGLYQIKILCMLRCLDGNVVTNLYGRGYCTEERSYDGGDCNIVGGYPNCHVDLLRWIVNGLYNSDDYRVWEGWWRNHPFLITFIQIALYLRSCLM